MKKILIVQQDKFSNKDVSFFSKLISHINHFTSMGQEQSACRTSVASARSYRTLRNQQFYNKRIEHQGLIKLRPVPFKNCIEIQTDERSLFLENIEITLKDLLQNRLYTNKLFPKEDIQRLIQNVTYTLAFLQQNRIPYKDVSVENIFYDQGCFKLLPNQLIAESRYQKFLSYRLQKSFPNSSQSNKNDLQFVSLSPEMIIAYRCKEPQINDMDIIDKSNVFFLGMLLLEVTTLLPAHECYDIETCDILDEVITERIQLVKEYYSDQIASIVANFLDYDYVERMSTKEASIFVNRELNRDVMLNSKISKELSNKKPKQNIYSQATMANQEPQCSDPMIDDHQQSITQSRLQTKSVSMCKSRFENYEVSESRISKPSQVGAICQKRKNKTNKVYMNGGVKQQQQESVSFNKEQRNKIYMRQGLKEQQSKRLIHSESQILPQRSGTPLKQIQNSSNISQSSSNIRPPVGKVLNISAKQRNVPSIPSYTAKSPIYQANQDDEQNRYPEPNEYTLQRNMKRKNSTDYLGYRAPSNNNTAFKTPKHQKYTQNQNKYQEEAFYPEQNLQNNYAFHQNTQEDSDYTYPSKGAFGQKYNDRECSLNQDSGSRGYFDAQKTINSKPNSNTDFKDHDNSLSRIKSEIQRSRKLIEEFKRGQNLQY